MGKTLTDRENDLFEEWSQELGDKPFVKCGPSIP